MIKNSKYFIIITLTIVLILGIVLIYKKNTYYINLYIDNNIYKTIKTKKDQAIKNPEKPEKEGYLFMGWYDEDNNIFNFENGTKKSINLYAHFGKIETSS